jgi:hypothetical protein
LVQSDLPEWHRWQNVYSVNTTTEIDTGAFFQITMQSLPFNLTVPVRVLNNDGNEKSLCWTCECARV